MLIAERRFPALTLPCVCRSPLAHARTVRQNFVLRRGTLAVLALAAFHLSAHAVIVRGRITDPLGRALPGARVQSVENGQVVGAAYASPDGSYEIRSADAGRFTLLGSGGGYLPGIGVDFYAGATDVVTQAVVLSKTTVQQEVSVTATGLATPLPQLV